eukprot:3744564-Rhodomonas_salina.1
MAIGHWLRFLCYYGTTLPGSAEHCTRDTATEFMEQVAPRARTSDWLTKGAQGGNCGDLIFSGHILLLLLYAIYGAFGALTLVQTLATLAKRNHYTIDIVVATMASTLIGER